MIPRFSAIVTACVRSFALSLSRILVRKKEVYRTFPNP